MGVAIISGHSLAMATDSLFEESIAWIRDHPCATNHDIPGNLRGSWVYDREDDRAMPGYQLAVFAYGLFQSRLIESGGNKSLTVSASEISQLFELWQMKLGMAEVHEKTEVKSKPLSLYRFPSDEQIIYWQERA